MRRNKFRAKRTGKYASKAEAAYAAELKIFERAGQISNLEEQESFHIAPLGCESIIYRTDFSFRTKTGTRLICDVKGKITDVFRLKMKLFAHAFPHIPVVLAKARYRKRVIDKFDCVLYHRKMKWKHAWEKKNVIDPVEL